MRELNSDAGAKENDIDDMEEYPPPRKNKSRESKNIEKDKKIKEKERSSSPDPESSLSILNGFQLSETYKASNKAEPTATKRTPYDHKNKGKLIKASILLSGVDK